MARGSFLITLVLFVMVVALVTAFWHLHAEDEAKRKLAGRAPPPAPPAPPAPLAPQAPPPPAEGPAG